MYPGSSASALAHLPLGLSLKAHIGPKPKASDACLIEWARDTNMYDCTNMFVDSYDSADLAGDYFVQAKPVVDLQIAKG